MHVCRHEQVSILLIAISKTGFQTDTSKSLNDWLAESDSISDWLRALSCWYQCGNPSKRLPFLCLGEICTGAETVQ